MDVVLVNYRRFIGVVRYMYVFFMLSQGIHLDINR